MSAYLVTRHPGLAAWIGSQGIAVDEVLSHLDPSLVERDDVVIGTLPVHLAEAVCARGAHYVHLCLDLPREARGRELSPEEMSSFGACLREYELRVLPGPLPLQGVSG